MRRMLSRPGRPRFLAAVAAVVLVTPLGLAACTSGDADGSAETSATSPAGTPLQLEGVLDTGFNVEVDGFGFPNYGNEAEVENLTSYSMRLLFGDQVCAQFDGEDCVLTPTAERWMAVQNDGMAGGHCFGMAGLAWALFAGHIDSQVYGADVPAQMPFEANWDLQADIATVFVTQATDPTSAERRIATPNQALEILSQAWAEEQGYVLGIYRFEDGEYLDGHAVTPYAIEDLGDGQVGIMLYDNNFPFEAQMMVVDTTTDTWTYSTSADPRNDPELYEGGADNPLELFPVDPMLGPQDCSFCTTGTVNDAAGLGAVPGLAGTSTAAGEVNVVYLNQEAAGLGVTISVSDLDGNAIEGLREWVPMSRVITSAPVIAVPKDEPFVVTVDAADAVAEATTGITIIGPGYSYGIEDFLMSPGDVDSIIFDPDSSSVTYMTSVGSAPDIVLSLDGSQASYGFLFGGLDLPGEGGAITVFLDPESQTVTALTTTDGDASIDFVIRRIDDVSDEEYTSDPIPLAANESLVIEYGAWQGDGTIMPIGIDINDDGFIDEDLIETD
ncbi:MAG: hypothetical protein ACYYNF_08100 [Actinomycetes bacterium]